MVKEHLVAYEYGTGTAWGYVVARSAQDIQDAIPEVDVIAEPPGFLTSEDLGVVREHCTFALEETTVDRIVEGKKQASLAMAS